MILTGMLMSPERLAAFLIAVSFSAGLNLYATTATLGLLDRYGVVALPPGLHVLSDPWVIGASAALFAIEFVADKIPVFDLVWNGLHTFIRIPAAALMSYAASAPLGPEWQAGATIVGGALALVAHGGKTAARAAVTPSPEPFSNFALSTIEDGFTIFVTWFATRHPFIAAGIVLVCVGVLVLLTHAIVRAFRGMFQRQRPAEAPSRT